MKYRVAIRQTVADFSVSCPGLPGCGSQGATEQEALENITDAIRQYLAAAAELADEQDLEVREVEIAL